MTELRYNEPDFDPEHYPIKPTHRTAVEQLTLLYEHIADLTWYYQATAQGVVVEVRIPEERRHFGHARLTQIHMEILPHIEGFRWIATAPAVIRVGLTH